MGGASEIGGVIDEYVLHARDREIMRRSMIDGQTYEAIAEAMDISSRTVGNRVRKWRPTVNGHLHF